MSRTLKVSDVTGVPPVGAGDAVDLVCLTGVAEALAGVLPVVLLEDPLAVLLVVPPDAKTGTWRK